MSVQLAVPRWVALRQQAVRGTLILLTAGLGVLTSAPQAALAASQEPSQASGGVSLVSAGGDSTCALEGGAAYCWGWNQSGQLGDGTTTDSSVPVAVDTSGVLAGKTLTQISVGNDDACALDSAGAAYCWGGNGGELGDGTTTGSSVPVAVDTSGVLANKTLVQISAGSFAVCALDAGGRAYCWGDNSFGELGMEASATPPASRWP